MGLRNKTVPTGLKPNLSISLSLIFVLFLVILWGGVIVVTFKERSSVIREEREHLDRMCVVLAEQIGNVIRSQRVNLKTLDIWLSSHPNSDPRHDPEFMELVENLRLNAPDIRVVSEKGELYYLPSKSREPLALVADREYFRAQQDQKTRGFFIASSVKSRVTGIWGIPASYPLTRPRKGISILMSTIELPALEKIFHNARTEEGGAISITRSDGTLLARSPFDESMIGRKMFDPAYYQTLQPGRVPNFMVVRVGQTDNKKHLVSLIALEDLPLVVAVSTDYDALYKEWLFSHLPRMIMLVLISSLILMVVNRFTKTLDQLLLTDKKLTETNIKLHDSMAELRENLAEKEVIIREANHRMKNQMTQLSSIIQLAKLHPETDIYETLRARIQSFAVLYEQLTYRENQPVALQLCEYVHELVNRVLDIYRDGRLVKAEVECGPTPGDSKKNTSVGMILCELITNSLKYAFPKEGDHRIRVEIQTAGEGKIQIVYSDNGSGFDFNKMTETEKTGHLGFILVRTLIRQYEGTLEYSRDNGSRFTIVL